MKEVKVQIKKLPHFDGSFSLPKLETSGSAGMDIQACLEKPLRVKPFERVLVPTGLTVAIPSGYEIQIRPRSGISYKTGLMMPNSIGTIDSDYRGELKVLMVNLSEKEEVIQHGTRVAQILLAPTLQILWEEVEQTSRTDRAEGGFGSTGGMKE